MCDICESICSFYKWFQKVLCNKRNVCSTFLIITNPFLDEGGFLFVHSSINNKDVPLTEAHVRGITMFTCKVIPDKGGLKYCAVTKIDPKGWIPTAILNMFKGKSGEFIQGIREILEEERENQN